MVDLAALRVELQGDPQHLGYAGGDNEVAAKLNAPSTAIAIDRGVIDGREVVSATTPAEFLALSGSQQNLYLALTGASGGVDSANALVRQAFSTIFGSTTATRAALVALLTRPGSRAEKLWGAGTIVDDALVGQAR